MVVETTGLLLAPLPLDEYDSFEASAWQVGLLYAYPEAGFKGLLLAPFLEIPDNWISGLSESRNDACEFALVDMPVPDDAMLSECTRGLKGSGCPDLTWVAATQTIDQQHGCRGSSPKEKMPPNHLYRIGRRSSNETLHDRT